MQIEFDVKYVENTNFEIHALIFREVDLKILLLIFSLFESNVECCEVRKYTFTTILWFSFYTPTHAVLIFFLT